MLNRLLDDQYEILAVLQKGETADLHYGWDHRLQRPVAIEELFAGPVAASDFLRRYLEAADRFRQLSHSNLVGVQDVRRDADGRVYIITEFVDGMGLDTALSRVGQRQKRLPPVLALFITRQILEGLNYIYSQAVPRKSPSERPVLLNLSARDVILAADGTVKVRGFGADRIQTELQRDAGRAQSETGSRTGTAEQSVLYSVGELLFEMLAGHRPWGAVDSNALRSRREPSRDMLEIARLPKPVSNLAERALNPDPSLRFPDAREMLNEASAAEHALAADDPVPLLADLVDALRNPEETQEHRRILMTRGSPSARTHPVPTSPARPLPDMPSPMAAAGSPPIRSRSTDPVVEPADIENLTPNRNRPRQSAPFLRILAIAIFGYIIVDLILGFGPMRRWTGIGPGDYGGGEYVSGRVVTIPPGAELAVNGVLVGRTPCDLESLPEGPTTLRLTAPGLMPIDTVLIISEGNSSPRLAPFVFRCRVHFNSVPAGATVIVDDHPLSDIEMARFTMMVTDTVRVAMTVDGEQPLPAADFNPLVGFSSPTDTTIWRWQPRSEETPGELSGTFLHDVRVHSDPPGASVYVDGDSLAAGETNLSLLLSYGDHIVTLRKAPFMDYRFAVKVGRDAPNLYAAVLKRTVHVGAIDRSDPDTDIGATIEWIRHGSAYVKTPFDEVKTPYSIQLGGVTHEIRLRHDLYRDTTVRLSSLADRLEVVMRPSLKPGRESRPQVDDKEVEAWVEFEVRDQSGAVADAEVIGVEKTSGVVVRYGTTGEAGDLVTKVPLGDYDWRAAKQGYEGRMNGERIKPGKGLKKITLRLAKR